MAETYTHTHTHTHTHGCLCKTIIPIIAGLAIINPIYADINKNAQSATCDSNTIGTTTGPANLQAAWTANTINLEWYSNNSKLTVGSSSATCTYDDGITLPSTPSVPTGYTFGGWKVRTVAAGPQCDFSGLSDTSTKGHSTYGYTRLNGNAGSNEAKYGLTQGSGEWAVEFYHGIIKGMVRCSAVGSGYTIGQTGSPTDDLDLNNLENGAKYCWCQPTSYTQKPWTYDTGDANTSPIYLTGYTNQSECKTAIRAITGLNNSGANTLLNNASSENPQLITNATGANVAYLTDSGCTTSGASVSFGEVGNECPITVSDSSWVFRSAYGDATNCANTCADLCAIGVYDRINGSVAFRSAVFGIAQ